jgi:hypothetical protein
VVRFDVNQGHRIATYEVNFGTMKQTNVATNFQRAVKRRLAAGAPGGVNIWSWEDDFGSWIPMVYSIRFVCVCVCMCVYLR